MASGSEKIMGLFKKWFGGNLFSKEKNRPWTVHKGKIHGD